MTRSAETSLTLLWLLASVAAGCNTSTPAAAAPSPERAPAAAQTVAPSQPAATDDWQRRKDCAEITDRRMKSWGYDSGKEGVMGWDNHYSPKYKRCFVRISTMNREASKDSTLPLFLEELLDAFEGKTLATCTDMVTSKARSFCTIQEDGAPKFDCKACRVYVDDRLNN